MLTSICLYYNETSPFKNSNNANHNKNSLYPYFVVLSHDNLKRLIIYIELNQTLV